MPTIQELKCKYTLTDFYLIDDKLIISFNGKYVKITYDIEIQDLEIDHFDELVMKPAIYAIMSK